MSLHKKNLRRKAYTKEQAKNEAKKRKEQRRFVPRDYKETDVRDYMETSLGKKLHFLNK